MSNAPRICQPELTYHVYTRCVNGEKFIDSDYWKSFLEEIIDQAMKKYNFQCNGFALEDNHFHLIIFTQHGGGSISRIMQFIKSRFALAYNRTLHRMGPLWNERFGDKIVELQENPFDYFFWLLWYLAYNSVKSGKVANPLDYRFSSISHYITGATKTLIKLTSSYIFMNSSKSISRRSNLLGDYQKRFCQLHGYLL